MPMVNSFGARKKAPYADALRRITTAAALRSFAVMTALARPVSFRSFGCYQVLCYEQIRVVLPTSPLFSHRFRKPAVGRGPSAELSRLIPPRDTPRKAIPPPKK